MIREILDFYRRPAGLVCALITGLAVALLTAFDAPAAGMPTALTAFDSLGDGVSTALIVNAANLRDVFRGFQNRFKQGFRSAEPQWGSVATLVPSTTAEERYGWLGQFPRLREWIGDRHVKDLEAYDYTIRNKSYESTVAVPRDAIEDDTFGVYSPLFDEMGHAAATHPDELVFGLLANGFSTLAYDGQNFFDTDHPVGGASVSNMQSGSENPWFLLDSGRPLKPLIFQRRRDYDLRSMQSEDDEKVFMQDTYRYGVDARVNVGFGFWQMAFGSQAVLNQSNFESAVASMMAFQSDEGRPLGIRPRLLVVGPSNRAAANQVVKVERQANGATNPNFNVVDVIVVPWLD